MDIIPEPKLRLQPSPSWEPIYAEVEREIVARISFASWRVNEAELARAYKVSRTVARDVVGRLQQRFGQPGARGLARQHPRKELYFRLREDPRRWKPWPGKPPLAPPPPAEDTAIVYLKRVLPATNRRPPRAVGADPFVLDDVLEAYWLKEWSPE